MLRRMSAPINLLFACVYAAIGVAVATAQDRPERAFVLDPSAVSVTAVDISNGSILSTAPLSASPQQMLLTRDNSQLLIFDQGPGKETIRFGYHPTGKSMMTSFDPKTMKKLWQIEVGWGFSQAFFSPDGNQIMILCPGYTSQKPQETLARELVAVDIRSGTVTARLAIDHPIIAIYPSPDGATAIAYSGIRGLYEATIKSPELVFIDLAGMKVLSTIPLEGSPGFPVFTADNKHLLLLDRGQPSDKPEKNINGKIFIVSIADHAIQATIDAGSGPRDLLMDDQTGQVLVLSDGPPMKDRHARVGELRIIRGTEIAATIKVARSPMLLRVSPNRQRLYVVCVNVITAIDYPTLQTVGQMGFEPAGSSALTGDILSDHDVSELAFSPDGKRGFVLYEQSSKLSVLDLEIGKPIASITTGRGGVKFAKFLGAMALTAASAASSASMAYNTGSPIYAYPVFTVAPANTAIAFRPDGRFVYVLNTNSEDVTIIDTQNSTVVDRIPADGRQIRFLADGKFACVQGSSTLHFIDVEGNRKSGELKLGGTLLSLMPSPDGTKLIALINGPLHILDGSTGRVLARVGTFKWPTQILFEGTGEKPAAGQTQSQSQPADTGMASSHQ